MSDIVFPEFVGFPKIARLNREVIVTEKVDGTNALIRVTDDVNDIFFGSKSRWVTPEADNFGFARWGYEHREELLKLGPGYHYGEWYGSGIQRGYGLKEKRFALFNVSRWGSERPACCDVVPELARGLDIRKATEEGLEVLRREGSRIVPGFARPEGVVVFHTASGDLYKVTLEKDESPKGGS